MNRIYEQNIEISSSQVQNFFESRFNKDDILASVMLRNAQSANIAHLRDGKENTLLHSLIDAQKKYTILDIGSASGRFAGHLKNNIQSYTGIDFAVSYIEAAKELYKNEDAIEFYQMSASELDKSILDKKYDLIIITGLCIYLNDNDLIKLFTDLNDLLAPQSHIYLRESISVIDKRLTLKDFPSEELETEYNAIYRTPKEYEELIAQYLPKANILQSDFMLTEETGARKETNQKHWFLEYKSNS